MPPVVVDTREQKPYRFPGISNVVRKKLNVGDYTHEGFEDVYSVERKSLEDLARSVTGDDRDRFEAEIQRASGLDEFAVVVEGSRGTLHNYASRIHNPNGSDDLQHGDGPYFPKTHPNSILGTADSWPKKYDPLEFKWLGDRESAKQETLRLLDRWYLAYGGSR